MEATRITRWTAYRCLSSSTARSSRAARSLFSARSSSTAQSVSTARFDGDEVVVLLFVEEFFEDKAIFKVVESFEGSILVVDSVEGFEGFVASSRSP